MTDNTEALQYADLIDRQHDGVVAATIIRELVAENEALRADAARYRYLRSQVNAEIDAAMREQK